jgi:uncharacterized protein (DUF736 family)
VRVDRPPAEGIPIKAATARPPQPGRNITMATIGSFTKSDDSFVGSVHTLSVKAKARIQAVADKEKASAPDYRIFAGTAIEIGAGWKKTARETGREYLSVKLDDPSFAAPIYASLVEAEDGKTFSLIWSRRSND